MKRLVAVAAVAATSLAIYVGSAGACSTTKVCRNVTINGYTQFVCFSR
jgi:3-hydroxyisobutyrate dehydrogenase-like beta-hydroxyacid dehydrogenase